MTMIAKEVDENAVLQNKYDDDDDDDEDETLSFYEFSINCESNNSSIKSSEQEGEEDDDYFEFFSEELKMSTTASYYQPENIIFCGKVIPYRPPNESETRTPSKNVVKEKKQRMRGFFRWKWSFMNSSHKPRKDDDDDDDEAKVKQPCTKQKCSTRERSKVQGFPVQKMSPMFASAAKSRWYLYLLGISRFRSEMELRDIKNRQSRRSPSFPLFRLESSNDDHKKRERKGAWVLLRALSCKGDHHQANAVLQAYRRPDSTCVN